MFYLRLNFIILIDSLLRLRQVCTPHKLELIRKIAGPEDVMSFQFKPKKPVQYDAGQYGVWFLPQFVKGKPARLFTVASAPETGYLEVTTRIGTSDFKQKLAALEIGKSVTLLGPIGRFTLPKVPVEKVVFIAGGIGITPFHALLQSIAVQKLALNTTLVYVGHPGSYLYQDELPRLANTVHFTTRQQLDSQLQATTELAPTAVYYVSGPPAFVESTITKLKQLNIHNVKFDGFLGYK